MSTSVNLWDQLDVPHKGWIFLDVIDTETAEATCEMCGNERIRYVHMMAHADYAARLSVGCVCAEKMADDYVNPRRRERKLRNAAAKRIRDKKRELENKETRRQQILDAVWQESKNGNPYLRINLYYSDSSHIWTRKIHAVVVKSKFTASWAFSVDGVFSSYKHASINAAMAAAKQEILRKFV
jgi:hypothetical protein